MSCSRTQRRDAVEIRLNLAPFRLEIAPEAGRKGAVRAGPASNPRQGGVAPRQRRSGLIGVWTAHGRAELGPGITMPP